MFSKLPVVVVTLKMSSEEGGLAPPCQDLGWAPESLSSCCQKNRFGALAFFLKCVTVACEVITHGGQYVTIAS